MKRLIILFLFVTSIAKAQFMPLPSGTLSTMTTAQWYMRASDSTIYMYNGTTFKYQYILTKYQGDKLYAPFGSGVASFNSRTGAVVPLTGDYSAFYVPLSRTISTTAPLTGGGALSSNLTLNMPASSSTVDGWLSAANFVVFSGKQATLNGTGYVKMSGTTSSYVSSIPNADLVNSTISGISLGSNLANLSAGTGMSFTAYNGSTARTVNADTASVLVSKLFLSTRGYITVADTAQFARKTWLHQAYGILFNQITGEIKADSTNLATKSYVNNFASKAFVLANYTPLTRSLTINGSAQTLAADRTWTITTTGTSNKIDVSGGTGLTPTITISPTYVGQSSLTTVGALTTGSLASGFTPVTNALLANSSLTIGSTNISLGGTSTTLAGLSSVTSTSFVGALTGNATTATALQNPRIIGTVTGDATSAGSNFDGTANNTNALTLATVNSNVGTFGSATQASVVTVNGKGLVTAASNTTITPAVGSITGLGTGVATALGVNIGTAGAFVVNGGALGTPSSGTITNLSGTCASCNIGGTATLATNLSGGLGGQIPYQSAVNTTAFLANGSAGQVLQSNGTTLAPTWVTLSASKTTIIKAGSDVNAAGYIDLSASTVPTFPTIAVYIDGVQATGVMFWNPSNTRLYGFTGSESAGAVIKIIFI